MAARRKSSGVFVLVAIALAIGAHVVVLVTADVLGWLDLIAGLRSPGGMVPMPGKLADNAAKAEEDRPLEIQALVTELEQPDEKSEEEKKREEEKKKEEEDKNPHGQVVDVAKPLIEQRPDKSNYVSEYDTTVERESRLNGRDHGGAKDGATPLPPQAPAGQAPNARPAQPDKGKGGRPGPLAMRDLTKPQPRGAEDSLPPDRDGERPRNGHAGAQPLSPKQAARGDNGDGQHRAPGSQAPVGTPGERKSEIMPTPEMLQRAIGKGGGSMDYLKDVDDGDATALNSKKWKHAPFFNRVKRAVAEQWHPELVYVRHDPNGNVYGIKDRVTVLRIHLQPDGKLAGWTVLQSSGVDFLDDEAIDAFKKSAPFPNPPKELVEADGQIHFNFAFIFELSGHNSLKVFKYQ